MNRARKLCGYIGNYEYREFGLQIRDLDSVAELEFQIKIPNWDLSFKLGTSDLDEISALNSVALCPVQVCYASTHVCYANVPHPL